MSERKNTEAAKAARRRYNATPKARAARARWLATDRGKESMRRIKAKSNAKNAAKIAAATRRRKQEIAERIAAIKLAAGCADCGYRAHAIALDFDHVGTDKRGDVSDLANSASWEAILTEIAKCEIVCANCHRIRTHERRQQLPRPAMVEDQGSLW